MIKVHRNNLFVMEWKIYSLLTVWGGGGALVLGGTMGALGGTIGWRRVVNHVSTVARI